jgi:hypothetical protein
LVSFGFVRFSWFSLQINLGLSGLSISGSPLMGLSLNPSISLSLGVFQTKRERKNKKE